MNDGHLNGATVIRINAFAELSPTIRPAIRNARIDGVKPRGRDRLAVNSQDAADAADTWSPDGGVRAAIDDGRLTNDDWKSAHLVRRV
jgi:hypothetical protein